MNIEIPERMHYQILDYVNNGTKPGDFLTAVFENNFVNAVGHADIDNLPRLPAYANLLYNLLPSACWGGKEKVQEWKGLRNPKNPFQI